MGKAIHGAWRKDSEHLGSVFGTVQAFSLPNGLKVLVLEDDQSPVSEVQTWFRAGSALDPPGRGGLAHLLEHLMFRGTQAVPGDTFDEIMEERGVYVNAATWLDWTSYRASLPAESLELVLSLEADRMTGLDLDAQVFSSEREVVRNERRQFVDNDPDGLASELLLETLFGDHPYGRPVLGTEAHISALRSADCKRFYGQLYAPALATVVVVGPHSAAQVLEILTHTHGRIRKRGRSPAPLAPPSPLTASVDLLRHWPVNQPRLSLAWQVPEASHPQQLPLKVLSELLAGAESCAFNNRVVEELAQSLSVECLSAGFGRGGLFELHLEPREASSGLMDALILELDRELQRLGTKGPSQEELDAARNRMRMSVLRGAIGVEGRCSLLGEYQATTGDYRSVFAYCEGLDTMTCSQVALATRTWLLGAPRVTLRILPAPDQEEA